MPIILTCPHDGAEAPTGVATRSESATPDACQFKTGTDSRTREITEAVAQRVLDLTGLSPYVVIALFHRKYIDANRRAECAFTDADAEPFYQEYHSRIDLYVKQIVAQTFGQGFLFDIHGTRVIDEDPADIYLGTANGGTLLPDFNRDSLFHQAGLHGLLTWSRHRTGIGGWGPTFNGFRVSPAHPAATETGEVNGGFTVRRLGSVINSIQVEITGPIRDDGERRGFVIDDLATGIINHTRRHARF